MIFAVPGQCVVVNYLCYPPRVGICQWEIIEYIYETWMLRAADQKYLESFEMWCWRRMEKISWTDHVRNEEVLLRVNEQRNILHEIRKRKANWIGHILRRNCLLKQVIKGNIRGRWKWQEDEEEDVRSYWITLRTGEDILIWRRRLWIALCGGIVLEEALDLSSDRILNEWMSGPIRACSLPHNSTPPNFLHLFHFLLVINLPVFPHASSVCRSPTFPIFLHDTSLLIFSSLSTPG